MSVIWIGSGTSLWTPAQITTSVWLDAADASTITIATGVSSWADKSGNGANATEGTTANQPAYSATSFGGLPGITFDGINDTLSVTTTAMRNTTHGVYWVWRRVGAGATGDAYKPTIGCKSPTSEDVGALHYVKNSNSLGASYPYFTGGSPNYDLTTGSAYATNTGYVHAFQSTNTEGWGVWRNGMLEGTTGGVNAARTADNGYTLASQAFPLRFSNIVISEFIMAPVVTATTRQLIEGYLAHKWGLAASLPSDHPYLATPP